MKYYSEYKEAQIEFEVKSGEVFANANSMCEVFGRYLTEWFETESVKRYIEINSRNSILTKEKSDKSIWLQEKLILKLAQWLDVEFEIWCEDKIKELICEESKDIKALSPAEMFLQNAQLLISQEKRIETVEKNQIKTDQDVRYLKSKFDTLSKYFNVMGYANIIGKIVSLLVKLFPQ